MKYVTRLEREPRWSAAFALASKEVEMPILLQDNARMTCELNMTAAG